MENEIGNRAIKNLILAIPKRKRKNVNCLLCVHSYFCLNLQSSIRLGNLKLSKTIFFRSIGIYQKTIHSPKFGLHSNKRNIDDAAKNGNFQSRYANKIENSHQILGTTGLNKLFFFLLRLFFVGICCVSSWPFFLFLRPSKMHNVKFNS